MYATPPRRLSTLWWQQRDVPRGQMLENRCCTNEHPATGAQRWPVHYRTAFQAGSGPVPTATRAARLVPDEHRASGEASITLGGRTASDVVLGTSCRGWSLGDAYKRVVVGRRGAVAPIDARLHGRR